MYFVSLALFLRLILLSMVRIPINDKCKIHKAFERQIQSLGGTNLLHYFKDLSNKGTRTHEGEVRTLDPFDHLRKNFLI